jgi:hypothetical protein
LFFAVDDFKSLLQNFGLVRTGLKFGNFGLANGESWKSQYRIYLLVLLSKAQTG